MAGRFKLGVLKDHEIMAGDFQLDIVKEWWTSRNLQTDDQVSVAAVDIQALVMSTKWCTS